MIRATISWNKGDSSSPTERSYGRRSMPIKPRSKWGESMKQPFANDREQYVSPKPDTTDGASPDQHRCESDNFLRSIPFLFPTPMTDDEQ
mmetsp:Transcript_3056/g.6767  ORF Transcript_3056/g.6767 Transcript_3056/m.6767 type:complete len:90 (+) Transcript_3056:1552-1821(+)